MRCDPAEPHGKTSEGMLCLGIALLPIILVDFQLQIRLRLPPARHRADEIPDPQSFLIRHRLGELWLGPGLLRSSSPPATSSRILPVCAARPCRAKPYGRE